MNERRTSPARILLAEDQVFNQRVSVAMLEYLGFQVDLVPDGAEAVRAATLTTYYAILMDCQLPVLDGYQATRAIRQLEGTSRRTPIIAVTGAASLSERQRCFAAGMDDHLTKPLRTEALAAALARWDPADSGPACAPDRSVMLPADGPGRVDAAGPDRTPLDPEIIGRLERLGKAAGEDFVQQLAEVFLSDADKRIVVFRDALAGNEGAAAAQSAHALSGASALLGATELARLCTAFETAEAAGDEGGSRALLHGLEAELERVRLALEAMAAAP